ncbi:hypothetical protein EF805_04795 [Staphylococcus pseudintermedius]|nr:hypothetical protein [Staphylococcus pseudintermedius]
MNYEKMWKQLVKEVLERMDKYALTDRRTYQFFRMLHDRMESIEKENKMESKKGKLWLGVVLTYLSLSIMISAIITSLMGFVVVGLFFMLAAGMNLIIKNL